ncbi:MAG: thioredoxin family protein [Actinomycetota bacterium]
MAERLLMAAVIFAVVFALYALWRRPPRKLVHLDLEQLGVRGPAIVQFSTEFCAPCHEARPHLESWAGEANIEYAHVDLDEHPEAVTRYGIRSVPTIVVADTTGEVLGRWTRLPKNGEISEAARRARTGV